MKSMLRVLVGVMVLGLVGIGYGANPDSFQVSCTPSVTYAITISTEGAALSKTGAEINQQYVYSTTATVVNSSGAKADWKIKGAALSTWTLGASPAEDTVRLLATLKSSIAILSDFNTTDDVITTGESNMDATHYADDQNGNNVSASGQKLLSIRIDTPTDTTVDTEQSFRVEVKAYPAATF